MKIHVRTKQVNYLHIWNFRKKVSLDVFAYIGDKIIFSYDGKMHSGILEEVGRKYIRIRKYSTLRTKKYYKYTTGKFEIEKIDRFAVYPKGTQQIVDIYCNSIEECVQMMS